jgi:antitoxin component YwqK of YwqJK toxin-antitoxin module
MRLKIPTILISVLLLAGLATFSLLGYMPGTLYFDVEGSPHGTGWKRYFYPNNALKLEEHYRAGQLRMSRWFRPDGTIIAETRWKDGNGLGYYLRDDGSVKTAMEYVHGLANGKATFFNKDGSVQRVAHFVDGKETPQPSP